MAFYPSYQFQPDCAQPAWWFMFQGDRLMVRCADGVARIPEFSQAEPLPIDLQAAHFIGLLDGRACIAAATDTLPEEPPGGLTSEILRTLFGQLPDEQFEVAGRASHIVHWDRMSRFCGRCGFPTRMSEKERAKICTTCGHTVYPRISPAVIVAVIDNDRILLAHSSRFPGGFYSVLAGFVEAGETLEECVAREIKEEAGIEVTDIGYFGSQPWPFPDSLMIAFTARFAGGVLTVDGVELDDAGWFTADALPKIPEKLSISRRLIDWFTEARGQ